MPDPPVLGRKGGGEDPGLGVNDESIDIYYANCIKTSEFRGHESRLFQRAPNERLRVCPSDCIAVGLKQLETGIDFTIPGCFYYSSDGKISNVPVPFRILSVPIITSQTGDFVKISSNGKKICGVISRT